MPMIVIKWILRGRWPTDIFGSEWLVSPSFSRLSRCALSVSSARLFTGHISMSLFFFSSGIDCFRRENQTEEHEAYVNVPRPRRSNEQPTESNYQSCTNADDYLRKKSKTQSRWAFSILSADDDDDDDKDSSGIEKNRTIDMRLLDLWHGFLCCMETRKNRKIDHRRFA